MVKEFQQLRKQMTQCLLEQQQQRKEMTDLVAEQAREKEEWFLDIIDLVEKLSRKETITEQALELEVSPKHDLKKIYNNIQSDLILLLSKYDVQPIAENRQFKEEEERANDKTLAEATYPLKRFTYQGKILRK